MMSLLGDQAYESAREEARRARGKDSSRANHYSYVVLRIAELTGRDEGSNKRLFAVALSLL